jgi:hypothetical protein
MEDEERPIEREESIGNDGANAFNLERIKRIRDQYGQDSDEYKEIDRLIKLNSSLAEENKTAKSVVNSLKEANSILNSKLREQSQEDQLNFMSSRATLTASYVAVIAAVLYLIFYEDKNKKNLNVSLLILALTAFIAFIIATLKLQCNFFSSYFYFCKGEPSSKIYDIKSLEENNQ